MRTTHLFTLLFIFISTAAVATELDQFFEKNALKSNSISLVSDGHELTDKRMEMISRANSSIYISQLHIEPSEETSPFFDLLCKKSKAKVDVRIIVDSFFSNGPFGKLSKRLLKDCGIRTIFYGQWHWDLGKAAQALHAKLLIVDGREVMLGGNGIAKKNIISGRASKIWHDLDMFIAGQSACYFHNKFKDLWKWSLKYVIDPIKMSERERKEFYARMDVKYGGYLKNCAYIPIGNSRVYPVFANPWESEERPLFDFYKMAIKSSSKSIFINAPFFVPSKQYSQLLMDAAQDNVLVEIIINSRESTDDSDATTYAQFKAIIPLIKSGVKVYQWKKKSTFHRKGGMFDGKYGYVGSDNHDNRGQEYSAESIAVFDDPKTIEALNAEHALDVADSKT